MTIFALDPGPKQTGWVLFDPKPTVSRDAYAELQSTVSRDAYARVLDSGTADNHDVLRWVRAGQNADELAIEMVAHMGMPVGREVFETVLWIGRFVEAWGDERPARLVTRAEVKLHLCGTARAKDPNVRQALIDKFGPIGTKKAPGPLHGVKTHAWAALGVAVRASELPGAR